MSRLCAVEISGGISRSFGSLLPELSAGKTCCSVGPRCGARRRAIALTTRSVLLALAAC